MLYETAQIIDKSPASPKKTDISYKPTHDERASENKLLVEMFRFIRRAIDNRVPPKNDGELVRDEQEPSARLTELLNTDTHTPAGFIQELLSALRNSIISFANRQSNQPLSDNDVKKQEAILNLILKVRSSEMKQNHHRILNRIIHISLVIGLVIALTNMHIFLKEIRISSIHMLKQGMIGTGDFYRNFLRIKLTDEVWKSFSADIKNALRYVYSVLPLRAHLSPYQDPHDFDTWYYSDGIRESETSIDENGLESIKMNKRLKTNLKNVSEVLVETTMNLM